MPLAYKSLSQPVAEPVTLQQAKDQCKVDYPDDDALIQGYIIAARQLVENMTGRSIFNRKMKMTLDYFPYPGCEAVTGSGHEAYLRWYFRGQSIRLPKPATASVDKISYIDGAGQTVIIDSSKYVVDLISEPARISPAPGYSWPYLNNYVPGQVTVEFTSGTYGDGKLINDCPMTVVLAILLLVSHFYNNRDASSEAVLNTIPLGVAELIAGEVFETVN
jgi:uncharacterized phiE125 gp8 family phage protein